MYWMKGRIFRYSRYKAWNEGIVTCRVNPKHTSRECALCHQEVARYHAGQPEEKGIHAIPHLGLEEGWSQAPRERRESGMADPSRGIARQLRLLPE